MLRYAEGLGRSEGLWQLGAAYLTDVLGELPHMAADRAADVRAKVSERLERLLVSEARRGAHALRVRKLLSVCERHALPAIAHTVVKEAAAAAGRARPPPPPPAAATALAVAATPAAARAPAAAAAAERALVVAAGGAAADPAADPAAAAAALVLPLASRALREALAAAAPAGTASAEARLHEMLRTAGLAGAGYYAGPAWLPPFFRVLALVRAAAAPAAAPAAAAELRAAIVALCGGGDGGAAAAAAARVPPPLMLPLVRLAAGCDADAPAALGGAGVGGAAAALSAPEAYVLLNEMETLKASKELGDFAISAAPGEGANPRAHELSATEKSLSLALTAALAASILDPEL